MVIGATSLWLAWNFEPIPLLALALLAGVYGYALGPARRRLGGPERPDRGRAALFYMGVGFLALALMSPLDFIGMHYLLAAHMAQHVVFTVVGPPLLLLGTPGWMLSPLLRRPRARTTLRWLTHPVVAFGVYNLNMWFWHIPALLDATSPGWVVTINALLDQAALVGALLFLALVVLPRLGRGGSRGTLASAVAGLGVIALAAAGMLNVASWSIASQPHNPIHTLMNTTFILTATLYWCPILNPAPELPRLAPLPGMLYMFISTQPMMALGAIITFSAKPLFTIYQHAPLLGGFTRLGDQQLAGLTMWLLMDIPLLLTISVLFFRWMQEQERKERERAALADELFWSEERVSLASNAEPGA
jgi:cytochrome c oxidase assembly factor CtaG